MTDDTDMAYQQLLAELSNALSDRTREAARESIALRDAVCEYVAIEHARGTALPDVIRTIKEILGEAESSGARASDALAQQLIDWCLEFHPGSSGGNTLATDQIS